MKCSQVRLDLRILDVMTTTEREIGRTGVRVKGVGLGAMPLSIDGRPDDESAIRVIHAALDAGTDLIDTADAYCLDEREVGHNERLIQRALSSRSDASRIRVATKGGCIRPEGRWEADCTPAHLRAACERSLKALKVPTIFLYQLHTSDPSVPYEDSIGELARLKQEGKILHIGVSNVSVEQLGVALSVTRIESVQNQFSPWRQEDLKNGVIEYCAEQGLSYIAYSPVGGFYRHRQLSHTAVLEEIAAAHAVSPYQVILAWHLAVAPQILPIPGASRIESAVDSAAALKLTLSEAEIKKISGLAK
jgi:aryl-alcohol dehydrogenase-like predicted oxidoreductase